MKFLRTPVVLLLIGMCSQAFAEENTIRYRGTYTYGHEVNTFCLEINSQCYWVSGESNPTALAEVKNLALSDEPYKATCVVVEGAIDRESKRQGFAADYDGMFIAFDVLGACEDRPVVTQGDLQHHRWVLESINGEGLSTDDNRPEIDFGELMTVAGTTGCNRYNGRAVLRDEFFAIEHMAMTHRLCEPGRNEVERIFSAVLTNDSRIRIEDDKALVLEGAQAALRFKLQDWL